MGRFFSVIRRVSEPGRAVGATVAAAEPNVQPVANVQPPEGPAPAWIVADMDTGQVLAGREMNTPHPPASTIKTLLVLTALDEVTRPGKRRSSAPRPTRTSSAAAQASSPAARTPPGRSSRRSADVGQRRSQCARRHDRRLRHAVAKMNAKAAANGALGTHASTPSGLDGPAGSSGATTPTRSRRHLPRRDGQPGIRPDHRPAGRDIPTKTGDRPIVNDDELLSPLSSTLGGKTGFTDAAKKTFVAAPNRGGRRLVIAMMYGLIKEGDRPYGTRRRASSTGASPRTGRSHRVAVNHPVIKSC